jgi:hypothetical protein
VPTSRVRGPPFVAARLRADPPPLDLLEELVPLKNPIPGFSDRLSTAADAKKARLAKFQSKPAVVDPDFERRHAEREAELEAVRAARAAERQAKKDASAQADQARLDAESKVREDADQARKATQRAELMAMYGRKRR